MRIVIIDRFPLVRFGLCLVFQKMDDDFTFIEEDTVGSFLADKSGDPWDMIIIGLTQHYPVNSSKLVAEIKRSNAKAKIVIYDDKPTLASAIYYLNAGCHGYVSKQADLLEMTKCVGEVLGGKKAVSRDILDMMFIQEQGIAGKSAMFEPFQLTENEYKIASYLSEGKSTSWIADKLERKASTVSTIKATIFRKLRVNNIVELRDRLGEVAVKPVKHMAEDPDASDCGGKNRIYRKSTRISISGNKKLRYGSK